jgi:hypothetical protein
MEAARGRRARTQIETIKMAPKRRSGLTMPVETMRNNVYCAKCMDRVGASEVSDPAVIRELSSKGGKFGASLHWPSNSQFGDAFS